MVFNSYECRDEKILSTSQWSAGPSWMGKCSEQSYQNHSKWLSWYLAVLSNGDCLKVLKCNLCLQFLSLQTSLAWLFSTWRNCTELPLNLSLIYFWEMGQKCDYLFNYSMGCFLIIDSAHLILFEISRRHLQAMKRYIYFYLLSKVGIS